MANTYDLTQLDSATFEHMVNFLALKELGKGTTGFAPGPDGGRDGYFKGEAPYPSESERWSGVWYIQSKFHKPSLSGNPNTWLAAEIQKEIDSFTENNTRRLKPDVWIIATNIDPSGVSQTGAFDKIHRNVKSKLGKKIKFDIWGGRRILDFLAQNQNVASYYGHFLTPGNVLTELYNSIGNNSAQLDSIINHLIVNQFNEQIYTKLEQAGSALDTRPKIHELFIDLPYKSTSSNEGLIFESIVASSGNTHKISAWHDFGENWQHWARILRRARVTVVKGGPGQGKSTIGQYFAQIQRAALILSPNGPKVTPAVKQIAEDLKKIALKSDFWPTSPRVPLTIELKDFAKWYGSKGAADPKGVLSYITDRIRIKLDQNVENITLRRALSSRSWFVTFDGLDEVPNDVKDDIADEIINFTNELIPALDADILVLCTTRPQGYSGQFERLDAATVTLTSLRPATALMCAAGVVKFGRTQEEGEASLAVLENAMASEQVRELMTTPLQAHIMAVVVRDGGRPPERRWQLFENFYQVMKKRETLKGFGDPKISKLLRENETLLKAIHSRLGISLHALAENSDGAETTLVRTEFETMARKTTTMLIDDNVEEVVESLMEATTERLVFVNTPDNSDSVRFDIRQLQEFFAGEFVYTNVAPKELHTRINLIGADSHWREVMHFMLSALVVTNRSIELTIAIQALSELDNEYECHETRTFKLRMAAGAITCLRLLNEGVLEQDKRIRSQFAAALKPVYALLSEDIIESLSCISHTNSLSWIINSMSDNLLEGSESEQISAAIALTKILPSNNIRRPEISRKIFSSSNEYLKYIYEYNTAKEIYSLGNSEEPDTDKISDWFITETIELLLNYETSTNPPKLDLNPVIEFLRSRRKQAQTLIESLKVGDNERNLLKLLILSFNTISKDESSKKDETGLIFAPYNSNWSNAIIPNCFDDIKDNQHPSQILDLLMSVVNFTKNKILDNYISILTKLKPFATAPNLLPHQMQALVPLNFLTPNFTAQIDEHLTMSEMEFHELISNRVFRGHIVSPAAKLISLSEFNIENWKLACTESPLLALEIWFSPIDFGNNFNFTKDLAFSDEILKIAIKLPSAISRYLVGWGKILDLYPHTRDELLNTFTAAIPSYDPFLKNYLSWPRIHPFKISIPQQLSILPGLAESFVTIQVENLKSGYRSRSRNEKLTIDVNVLQGFGLDLEMLKHIYQNESGNEIERISSLAIFLSHQSSDPTNLDNLFFNEINDIFESLHTNAPNFLAISVLTYANNYMMPNDPRAIKLIGGILNRYRDNYTVSEAAQHLVAMWRERSLAPIHSNQSLENWLNYNIG